MFVEARIAKDTKKVNALPEEAFIRENGLDYIFVLKERHENNFEFERIQVNKGISDLGFFEVALMNKIPKDTKVVTKGSYYVNAELNKGDFEEHEH
jgi:membrane fusion protein, heavy metal efflux system